MAKRIKRAFTITELVIVIAVVAILAAVLIPTFANIINRAEESADTQTVANINQILSAEEIVNGKPKTMYDAVAVIEQGGYRVENLTPTRDGYDIVWDETSNRLALMDGDKLVYGDDAVKSAAKEKLWKITREDPEAASGYSYYLAPGYAGAKTISVSAGIDAGENSDIAAVTLNIPAGTKNVTVRTNGGTFTMYAPDSEVSHYGEAESAEILAAAPNTYTLYGRITGTLTVRKGHADLRTGSYAALLVCEPASGESVEITYASTENVGEIANNGNDTNVTLPGDAAQVMLDKTFAYAPNADGTGYVVTGFGEEATAEDKTNAVIPATYSGKPVVEIGKSAFSRVTTLQSVTIPASVETISENAFNCTTELEEVIFEDGSRLQTIADGAFATYNTESGFIQMPESKPLKIKIPAGVTVMGTDMQNGAFQYRPFAEFVFEEDSALQVIGSNTFKGCRYEGTFIIPASVETVGDNAFEECEIDKVIFAEGSRLKDRPADDANSGFGYKVFLGSTIERVTFAADSTFTVLPNNTFGSSGTKTYVQYVDLPANLKTIGASAFMQNTGLLEIQIPSGVTKIGASAFADCKNLSGSVTIPNGVTMIENAVFDSCNSLEAVNFASGGIRITSIGEKAFRETSISSIDIPENVSEIKAEAFFQTNIPELDIPSAVKIIGDSAFYYCKSLKKVTFAENSQLVSIGAEAFFSCDDLTIIIPATVTTIGNKAFGNNSSGYECNVKIYSYAAAKPEGWDAEWYHADEESNKFVTVYWNGEWELQDGVPVPLSA